MKAKVSKKEKSPEKKEKSPKKKTKTTKTAPDQKMMREISATKIKQIEKLNNSSRISNEDDPGIKVEIKKKASSKKVKAVKALSEMIDKDRQKSTNPENEMPNEMKESLKALTQNKNSISKIKDELAKKRLEKEAVKSKIKAEREKARQAVEERRQAEKDLLEQKIKEREAERIKKQKAFEEKKAEKEQEKQSKKKLMNETSLAKTLAALKE